jgi:hypothetical protein
MSSGKKSNRENPRLRNLKVNNKDNLRFSSQNNSLRRKFSGNRDNLRRKFSSRKDKSKDLRFRNHNSHSLKKNLKEGMRGIESRIKMGTHTIFCRTSRTFGVIHKKVGPALSHGAWSREHRVKYQFKGILIQ